MNNLVSHTGFPFSSIALRHPLICSEAVTDGLKKAIVGLCESSPVLVLLFLRLKGVYSGVIV